MRLLCRNISTFGNLSIANHNHVVQRFLHRDITVIGGNLIGACTAVALASSPAFAQRKISLVERRDIKFPQNLEEWSNRVYAITPGTRKFLERQQIWQKLTPQQIHVCRRMLVWENQSDAALDFRGQEVVREDGTVELDTVCYNLDQHALLHAIYERLKELPNIELRARTRITNIELPSVDRRTCPTEKVSYGIFDEPQKHTSDLLIAADGFNSQIRKLMGVKNVSWSYKQKSVIAVVELDGLSDVDGIAFQRFLPEGVVALLPLGNRKACLIWSLVDNCAEHILKLTDDEFVDTLNKHLNDTLEYNQGVMSVLHGTRLVMNSVGLRQSVSKVTPPKVVSVYPQTRASYPLGMGHAVNYVVPRTVLVGDSAHRVHPLAGQGANFGFADVECLERNLTEAAFRGEQLGDIKALMAYERERQFALLPFQVAIEGLIHIYQNNNLPIVLARSLGVQILDSLPYVKQKIIQFASR